MNKLFLGSSVVLAAAIVAACGPLVCPALDCADAITIKVTDSSGAALNDFHGTVKLQGREVHVACGTDAYAQGDAGTADGGSPSYNETAGCAAGQFTIYGGGFQPDGGSGLDVELHAGTKSFTGNVPVTFTENRVGDPACNSSCRSGAGSVAVQ